MPRTMPSITELPCEIINAVLRHVGSLQNLSSALRTCKHFDTSFKENPHIALDIVRRQITPALLPYAIVVMEASTTPPAPARREQLLDELRTQPSKLTSQLPTMSLPQLSQLSRTHSVIHGFVTDFSTSAWIHLSRRLGGPRLPESVSLSPTEYYRFCRAFYWAELYFRLFRSESPEEGDGAPFLSKLQPWEIEQIGCAHDFLELQFSKASRDVLAHDVVFGEYSIDYLTPGGDNLQRQLWLSQGVEFINRLIHERSYNAKHALLTSAYLSDGSYLFAALIEPYHGDEDDDTLLKDYTDEQRATLFRPSDPQNDADKGPFEVWYTDSEDLPLHSLAMNTNNYGFRERAYVLWDKDRLQKYNLLELFAGASPESELEQEDSEAEHDTMTKSFDERSKIWQKAGRGYWSPGDETRIVWPKSRPGGVSA